MLRPPSRARRRASLLVALAGAALACGDGPTGPRVGDIVLQPTELRLRQKETHRVSATVTDASGTLLSGIPVTFASTNEGIVTVSSIGEVTSVGPAGSAIVRVTARGFTKNLAVTVEGIATSVQVTPSPATMPQKGTLQLQARVLDLVEDAIPGQAFTFTSLTPTLLTVNPAGVVTSLGAHGTGRVRVRSGELTTDVEIAITQVPTNVRVSPAAIILGRDRSAQLRAWIVDAIEVEIAAAPTITYATSDAAIVTVDGDGLVRSGSTLGEATITARSGDFTATVPVRVVESSPPTGVIAGTAALAGAYGVAFTSTGVAYAVSLGMGVHRVDLDPARAVSLAGDVRGLDLAITADGTRAYVARQDTENVQLVELATGAVLATSPQLDNSALTDLLWPDQQTLWVGTGRGVSVLDATSLAVLQTIAVGTVVHLARHPTLPYVYASSNGNTVSEIDVGSRTVRRTFTVGNHTQGVAVSPTGEELYVADENGPLRVVTLANGAVSSFAAPAGGYGLAMSPDGLRLYVTLASSRKLVIVDPTARAVVATVALPGTPRRIAVDPDGSVVLVATESGGVVVIR